MLSKSMRKPIVVTMSSSISLLFSFSVVLIALLQTSGSLGYASHGHHKNTDPIARTPLGSIRGTTLTSRKGATILSFLGVRFAEPPINELRFQPPVPVRPWKDTYNATKNSPACPQEFWPETNEDCLFLNVYTLQLPSNNKPKRKPVMVFFHPGGFIAGTSSSDGWGPQYLMDQDIVLVMTNYRLQSLGFLATGTPEAPGNYGLKDQVQVLRWVQENIASFNGDTNDVTISGYSAGGFSVTLHMLSPMSKGLFHKAISMSGSIYGNKPYITDQLKLAKRQAELLSCPTEPTKALVDCLKTKTAKELSTNLAGYRKFYNSTGQLWWPVVEPDFGQERFLTENPIKLVVNKKVVDVPVMIGVTYDEFGGSSYSIVNDKQALEEFDKDYKRAWPIVFRYEGETDFSFKVSDGLRKYYFPDNKIDVTKRPVIAEIFADSIIGFGANRGAKLLAEHLTNKVYYYRFNYKNRYSFFYTPGTNDTVPDGVAHHDDLLYLFYTSRRTPMFTDGPDADIVDKMTELWGNFVKHGSPDTENYKWPPFELKKQQFLDISTTLTTKSYMFKDRYDAWEKLYPISLYLN